MLDYKGDYKRAATERLKEFNAVIQKHHLNLNFQK